MDGEEKLIGKVTHYYGKIGVAIIALEDSMKVGDRVRFAGNMAEFEQTVESMQVEHQDVAEAKAGEQVGVKVDQKVNDGTTVYKISE